MWSWPIWFVADIVVADMVCGRYGTDPDTAGQSQQELLLPIRVL